MNLLVWVSVNLFRLANHTTPTTLDFLFCFRHQGLGALYKGMEAKLLQTVLTAALMFVAYEKIAAFTFKVMGLQTPAPKS